MPTNAHSPLKIFSNFYRFFLMTNYFSNTPRTVALKMPSRVGNVTTVILQLPIICLQWKSLTVCLSIHCKLIFLSLSTLHHYKNPLLLILHQSHSIPVINLCQTLKSNHTEHSSHSYWIHCPITTWNSLPIPFLSNLIQLHHSISDYSKL